MRTRSFGTISELRWQLTARDSGDTATVAALFLNAMPEPPVRIVIVDDHELFSTSLAMVLGLRGLEVQAVAGPDPEAVIDVVRAMAPVLVLLDLDLGPNLGSGLDLIQPAIVAGGRVVMMTGVIERGRLGACIEAGAAGVVCKTVGFAELVGAIQRAVGGEELLADEERQELLGELARRRHADWDRFAPFATLSSREHAIFARLVAGESAETIAGDWGVSLATVRSQIRSILLKLGVKSQLAAVALARHAGWPAGACL